MQTIERKLLTGRQPIAVGIIGCGRMGQVHAEVLAADGRARLAGLCDPNRQAAERVRADWAPHATVYADWQQMLRACRLDAAVVCTPTDQHFEQVRVCRARGLHVLCEKPLADTRERIVQLIEEHAAGGPELAVAYQRRGWPAYSTLRREVRCGRWGAVHAVVATLMEDWQQGISGTWRDDPKQNPGGYVGDAGSHILDAVFYVTDRRPRQLFAFSDRRGSHVQVVTTVCGWLDGQAALSLSFVGNAQHLREDMHVHCERADLMVRDLTLWISHQGRWEPCRQVEQEQTPAVAFLDLITGSGPNVAPPSCALPVFDATAGILESARTGRAVRFD